MTRYRYDDLELRVDPEPVRLACVACGALVTKTPLCPDCEGRSGNAVGILTVALLILVITVVIALLAASRGDPDAGTLTGLTGPGLLVPPGEDTPTTNGMRPASDGAAAAATPPAATPAPASHLGSRQGDISHMGPGYPKSYLALPCKHGTVRCHLTVRLCGPADCVTLRQTDYGPSQRVFPDRIADVSIAVFERICGQPARTGICPGSWTVVSSPLPTLPATDVAPMWETTDDR